MYFPNYCIILLVKNEIKCKKIIETVCLIQIGVNM